MQASGGAPLEKLRRLELAHSSKDAAGARHHVEIQKVVQRLRIELDPQPRVLPQKGGVCGHEQVASCRDGKAQCRNAGTIDCEQRRPREAVEEGQQEWSAQRRQSGCRIRFQVGAQALKADVPRLPPVCVASASEVARDQQQGVGVVQHVRAGTDDPRRVFARIAFGQGHVQRGDRLGGFKFQARARSFPRRQCCEQPEV